MHAWIISHPITFAVFLFVAAIPFSIYSTEIKQFLKIPPQRLNVWILKARLSSAEDRLWVSNKLRNDMRFFVYVALRTSGLDLAAMLCTALTIGLPMTEIIPKQQTPIWFIRIAVYFFLCADVACFLKAAVYMKLLREASSVYAKQKLDALNEKIENLRRRLEEKGQLTTT